MDETGKDPKKKQKKLYAKPRLTVYGTLRKLTSGEIKVPGAPEGGLGSLPS